MADNINMRKQSDWRTKASGSEESRWSAASCAGV